MYQIKHVAITGDIVPDNAEHVEYEYGAEALIVALERTERDGATRYVVSDVRPDLKIEVYRNVDGDVDVRSHAHA